MDQKIEESDIDGKCARVSLWHVRGSSRKMGIITDMVRGKYVSHALSKLRFCPKRLSAVVAKSLQSAVANAKILKLDENSLFVSEIHVGRSKPLKRLMPRARGRANRIEKPCCNLKIIVKEKDNNGTEG